MNEQLNQGEVVTIEDGELSVSKHLGFKGRPECKLKIPATDFGLWTDSDRSGVYLVIDENTAQRLARLINKHMGEHND